METRRSVRCLTWLAVATLVAAAPALAVKRRAFATSVQGTGNLSAWADAGGHTGLAAGDAICRARATAAGLPNAGTYRAWLSTSATDAYCHVQGLSGTRTNACLGASQPGGGPWYQANGITAFTDTLARLAGPEAVIYRNLLFDELGQTIPYAESQIWTGTGPWGSGTGEDCTSWGTNAGTGLTGSTYDSAYHWTYAWERACNEAHRLLCLEPGASEPLVLTWSPGALVFVTDPSEEGGDLSSWPGANGAQGIAAGDAVCRAQAAAAHLPAPESFVAWLSTAQVDAISRLTTDGPFRRVDGMVVANGVNDLVDGQIQVSIHVRADGGYLLSPGTAWTGSDADGTWGGTDCGGWTTAASGNDGHAGGPSRSREPGWTAMGPYPCTSSSGRLYCFSNVITIFWDGFDYTGDTGRWSSTTF